MTKIKICGITRMKDYNHAVSLGTDYTGFVFYDKSPRRVSPETVSRIITDGKQGKHLKVGVFVNETAERIKNIVEITGIDIVQLHGDESPEFCARLDLPYWKVLRVMNFHSINTLHRYPGDTFLLDTYSKHLYGGTGNSFNTRIAEKALESGRKIILAGGINADNINIFTSLLPHAIDISSSIEDVPGKKNFQKMEALFVRFKNNTQPDH
jgi:phosphoribosylanthranilate isomerase